MSQSKDIKVGDKVIIMGELHTTIIEIVETEIPKKYYFLDEDGRRWYETIESIKNEEAPRG